MVGTILAGDMVSLLIMWLVVLVGLLDIRLGSAPSGDVTIGLSSTRPGEGSVTPNQVTFTPAAWNVRRTVTVKGRREPVEVCEILGVEQ